MILGGRCMGFALVCVLVVVGCRTTPPSALVKDAESEELVALRAKFQSVDCVLHVNPESQFTLPPHNGETGDHLALRSDEGRYVVRVKDDADLEACVTRVMTAVPDVVVDEAQNLQALGMKFIYVRPAARVSSDPQLEALRASLRGVDCVMHVNLESRYTLPPHHGETGDHLALRSDERRYVVRVKDGAVLEGCILRVMAAVPAMVVDEAQNLQALGMKFIYLRPAARVSSDSRLEALRARLRAVDCVMHVNAESRYTLPPHSGQTGDHLALQGGAPAPARRYAIRVEDDADLSACVESVKAVAAGFTIDDVQDLQALGMKFIFVK